MKNSLLFTFYFPPAIGGIENYLSNICLALPSQMVVIAPIMMNSELFDQKQDYKIYRYNFYHSIITKNPRLYRILLFPIIVLFIVRALPIIKKEKIDIIQCGSPDFCLAAWCLSRLTQKPYIAYTYGKDVVVRPSSFISRIWKSKVVAFGLKKAAIVVTISEYTAQLLTKMGISKINLIHPCLEENKHYPSIPEGESIRNKWRAENKRIILSVGRLVERKGQDNVIRSMPEILRYFPDVLYIIVGKGHDEPRLKNLVADLDLESKVIFTGYVPEERLNAYYNACDILIMPSRELPGDAEGFGIVYLEANACGKPVIGGKSGGVEDAVTDKVTGLLVNPVEIKEIAQAVITLLGNKELAEKLGKQGCAEVLARYSLKSLAIKMESMLTKC